MDRRGFPLQGTETPLTESTRTDHETTAKTDLTGVYPELLQCNISSIGFSTASTRHAKDRRGTTAAVSTVLRTVGDHAMLMCHQIENSNKERGIIKLNMHQRGQGAVRGRRGNPGASTERAQQTRERIKDEGHAGQHWATDARLTETRQLEGRSSSVGRLIAPQRQAALGSQLRAHLLGKPSILSPEQPLSQTVS